MLVFGLIHLMINLMESSALELTRAVQDTLRKEAPAVREIAEVISGAFAAGGKVLLCGNGGSAADCQHLAAEFVNRFRKERRPLPAVALTTDSSVLTAIANDYSFGEVFKKQVQAMGRPGDVLIGISTSGASENVTGALLDAGKQGMATVGLTGKDGGEMAGACRYLVRVRSSDTPRIQEVHIFLGHLICDMVERTVFEK